ncbi:phosphoribosyltransferase [Microbacterium hominis]|uniref:Phosphoribosyltransferase domain-containing protein n=1 Tax=Microbacterium hominis TaxID=162426 RepID=A0A7D4UGF0_9MICO|nr:phosphoribosyltransferase family protein [Microbacterium hominis]QKJ19529.1 hypothetical protein HQM25_09245 [Microbacterium hominis]
MSLFADRIEAGDVLAAALARWRGVDAVVLGIPRGGVVVAARVAAALDLRLGAVVVRKLGAPRREEYAVGAIAPGVRVVDERALRREGVTSAALSAIEERERAELERRTRAFGATGARDPAGTVIVVDDGIATGATAEAACRSLRAAGTRHLVLAVPVAPRTYEPARSIADEFVCPHRMDPFWAVGSFYDDFRQTEDEEVARLLAGDLPD